MTGSIAKISLLIVVAGLGLLAAGCSTTEPSAAKRKYVYVPTTGSHIGRRVAVKDDGTLADSQGDGIQTAHPSVLNDMQRKGSARPGRGN